MSVSLCIRIFTNLTDWNENKSILDQLATVNQIYCSNTLDSTVFRCHQRHTLKLKAAVHHGPFIYTLTHQMFNTHLPNLEQFPSRPGDKFHGLCLVFPPKGTGPSAQICPESLFRHLVPPRMTTRWQRVVDAPSLRDQGPNVFHTINLDVQIAQPEATKCGRTADIW